MKVITDVIDDNECQNIIQELMQEYPILTEKSDDFKVSDKFAYLDYIAISYIDQEVSQISSSRLVLCCHSWDTINQYAGWHWHTDGDDDKITAVLYLQGNENAGGELEFRDKLIPFRPKSLTIFDSSVEHRVTVYRGELTRLAIRWTFKKLKSSAPF